MAMAKEEVKESKASPVKVEAPKTDKAEVKAPKLSIFDEAAPHKDAIASENIRVMMFIGSDKSPNFREVQMDNLAREIKAHFS